MHAPSERCLAALVQNIDQISPRHLQLGIQFDPFFTNFLGIWQHVLGEVPLDFKHVEPEFLQVNQGGPI